MISYLLLLGLLGFFAVFGYVFSTRILHVKHPFVIAAMLFFFGEAFYTMCINALGYFIPIRVVFWLVLILMLCIIIWGMQRPASRDTVDTPQWVQNMLWCIALFVGIAFMRVTPSDSLSLIHYPVPASILEGNFPIYDPFNPWNVYGYHYAPMLLAAAVTAITGVDIAMSYAIQSLLQGGGLVFFAASIGYILTRSAKGALLVAICAIGGTGFFWWYGWLFFQDIYATYIAGSPLHPEYQTPFRYLSYMFGSTRVTPLVGVLIHRAVGMGVTATLASVYALYEFVEAESSTKRWQWGGMLVVFTSVLALSLETTFVIFFAGVLGAVLLHTLTTFSRKTAVQLGLVSVVCFLVAIVQGGVITSTLTLSGDTRPSAFFWSPDWIYHLPMQESIAIWDVVFMRDAGFTLLLLPLLCIVAWRRRMKEFLPLFIAGLAVMHFAIPFLIDFPGRSHSMDRVLHIGSGLSALLLAWWVWKYLLHSASVVRHGIAIVIIVTTVLSTALQLPVRMIFPDFERGRSTFVASMPSRTEVDSALHAWVRENSDSTDRFFFIPLPNVPDPVHDPAFSVFVGNTGRFLVKRGFNTDTVSGKDDSIFAIEKSCDARMLQKLGITHVIVKPGIQREWFSVHCRANLFTSVYSTDGVAVYTFSG